MANILAWLVIYNLCTVNSSDTNGSGIESNHRSGRQKNKLRNKKPADTKIETKHEEDEEPSCPSGAQNRPKKRHRGRRSTQDEKNDENPEHVSSSNTAANVSSTGMVTKMFNSEDKKKAKIINIIRGTKGSKIVAFNPMTNTVESYMITKGVKIEGNNCRRIKTRALPEMQEKLASCPGEKFTEKISDHYIVMIQLGLILGNEIEKKLTKNGQDPKQYSSIDKSQENVRQSMFIKSNEFLNSKNSDEMNEKIYEDKSCKYIILEILLFFYDHPEMLINNRNEQYHVSHDVVRTALIDHLIEKDILAVYAFETILEFKKDSSTYIDLLDRCCYSVVVSLSIDCLDFYRIELCNIMIEIEEKLKDIYKEHGIILQHHSIIIIEHVENLEFIEDSIIFLTEKLCKQILLHQNFIWDIKYSDIGEYAELQSKDDTYINFLKKIKNRVLSLKEKFDIMLEGHNNLCKLVQHQIQQKDKNKTSTDEGACDDNVKPFVESDDIPKRIADMLKCKKLNH